MTLNALSVASLASTFNSCLVFTEVDERRSQASPVRDTREQKLGGLVELVVEALFTDIQNIRNIGHGQEVLHIVQSIGLGISMRKFSVDLWFPQALPGHLEEANKVVVLVGASCQFNDLRVVRRVLCLDVRVYERR